MWTRRVRLFSTGCLLVACMAWASHGQPSADNTLADASDALGWALVQAETALDQGETQKAESHYATALLEGWTLLARLDLAAGDLDAAREHLDRAAHSAVEGVDKPRELLQQLDAGTSIGGGPLAQASSDERLQLRHRVVDTLRQVHVNVGVLHRWADRPERAQQLFSKADAIPRADTDGPATAFGTVHLDREAPRPSLDRQPLDSVALVASLPESLRPVLELLDGGQLDAAEADLRQRLDAADPAALETHTIRDLLGMIRAHRGHNDDAEALFWSVLDAKPNHFSAHQNLARLYLVTDRRAKGLEHLRHAAELGDLDRDLSFHLAEAELADGRLPAANRQMRQAGRKYESPRAYQLLVETFTRLRNRKMASNFAERALRLAPNSEEVLATHARAAVAAQLIDTARRSAEPLAALHPEVVEYQVLLGNVWLELGDHGEASESLGRAVALDPDHRPAFLPLALALNHESRYADARPYLEALVADDPGHLDAQAALAEVEERLGEPDAAERRLQSILDQDPNHPAANLVLGLLHFEGRRFDEARGAFETALDRDPSLVKAHYQLSLTCARLGDRPCAQEHLDLYRKTQKGREGEVIEMEKLIQEPTTMERAGSEGSEEPGP